MNRDDVEDEENEEEKVNRVFCVWRSKIRKSEKKLCTKVVTYNFSFLVPKVHEILMGNSFAYTFFSCFLLEKKKKVGKLKSKKKLTLDWFFYSDIRWVNGVNVSHFIMFLKKNGVSWYDYRSEVLSK